MDGMSPVVLWLLLLLVQQHGPVGLSYGSQAECEEARGRAEGKAEILAISTCQRMELKRNN